MEDASSQVYLDVHADVTLGTLDNHFIHLLLSNSVGQAIPLQFVPDPAPLLKHLRKLGLLRPTPRTFILF